MRRTPLQATALSLVLAVAPVGCSASSDAAAGGEDGGGGGGGDGGFITDVGIACPDGKKTTVSGTVYSPAKSSPDPLYDAVVFIPKETPAKFPVGVTCG